MTKTIENGQELAQVVVDKYGTTDPFLLAERAGVQVEYAHWHPVTWGEYDVRSQLICLNINAPIPLEQVLAHELGHYFAGEMMGRKNKKEEEEIANNFVEVYKIISKIFTCR